MKLKEGALLEEFNPGGLVRPRSDFNISRVALAKEEYRHLSELHALPVKFAMLVVVRPEHGLRERIVGCGMAHVHVLVQHFEESFEMLNEDHVRPQGHKEPVLDVDAIKVFVALIETKQKLYK